MTAPDDPDSALLADLRRLFAAADPAPATAGSTPFAPISDPRPFIRNDGPTSNTIRDA